MREVKLRRMGGSIGATLPADLAERLHLKVGDSMLAIETQYGVLLSPYSVDVLDGLRLADEAAREFRNPLRRLAR